MIFVCLGTQIYPFDRLLIQLDRLVSEKLITDDVFVQSGTLNYIPKHLNYTQFLSHEDFDSIRERADLIIAHGGTGALIGASKLGKNIIAVPRLSKFGEHVDDHQLQIVHVLEKEGYVRAVYDMDDLLDTILVAMAMPLQKKYERTSYVIELIDDFIRRC